MPAEPSQPHLERSLGLLESTALNMSNMAGAGVHHDAAHHQLHRWSEVGGIVPRFDNLHRDGLAGRNFTLACFNAFCFASRSLVRSRGGRSGVSDAEPRTVVPDQ